MPNWIQKPALGDSYRIKNFCCCLGSVKTGTILIAVIYTILALLAVAVSFSYFPSDFAPKYDASNLQLGINGIPGKYGILGYEMGPRGTAALIILAQCTSIFWLIVNVALLYGAINDSASFVTPWIGWHLVLMVVQIIIATWCGDILTSTLEAYAVELATLIISVVINEGLMIYFFIVVNSYHLDLKEEIEQRPPQQYGRLGRYK
ncbi:uncharacterized protein [Periplaneta americana]|uniref:uncharacterized protein isoform X2 n=1 Tax=Periplaneta americana TaxID=6978 RepID=UPI0037E755B8